MTEPEANNLSLTPEEAQFAQTLRNLAEEIQPEAGFQAGLERKLMKSIPPTAKAAHRGGARWPGMLGWAALAALLLIGLSWTLTRLIPYSALPGAASEIPLASATSAATQDASLLNPTLPPGEPTISPSPAPLSTVYVLSMRSDYDFVVQADWPESPTEATIYQQIASEELTIENARQVAEKLGLAGKIYSVPNGAPGQVSFRIQDGERNVTFYNSPRSYQYEAKSPNGFDSPSCQPPCLLEGGEGALLRFLNEHSLLDFQATSQASLLQPQVEQLTQIIDGLPVNYSPSYGDQGQALIGANGEVLNLDFNPVQVEAVGKAPLLTAQQAWQQAIDSKYLNGIEMGEHSSQPMDLRIWNRRRPLDQRVEMFGYITSFLAAEPGKPPLILFDGYPASGHTQGMADIKPDNSFVQVWGTFLDDQQGGRKLDVDGWQIAPFPTQSLTGTIQMQGDKAYILTNGRRLLLPDLPTDLPLDRALRFNGVVLEQPEPSMEWSSISNQLGGGGGGGGGAWAEVYLEGATNPLPTATPTPIPPDLAGQRVDGLQGRPWVFIHQYSDGSTRVEVMFNPEAGQSLSTDTTIYLEGAGVAGIEKLHNLPVRIFGVISESKTNLVRINLERVEPVYPGVSLQAWLGKFDQATLDGKEVRLLRHSDGTEYVLNSSLDNPGLDNGIAPGDPVVVEGIIIPDHIFAGYTVITDYSINPAPGMQSLHEYRSISLSPVVIPEPGKAGSRRIGTVTKIDLAYYTDEPRNLNREPGAPLPFVQPVWRFTGAYDDGAWFQVIVQALNPQYLRLPE